MFRYIFVILLCLGFSTGKAQTQAYVWNIIGISVKDSPTKHSETIKTLKFGDKITRAHFTASTPTTNTIQPSLGGYAINSKWTMVELGDTLGFVFEGDISNSPVPIIDEYGMKKIDYKVILGDMLRDTTLIKEETINGKEFQIETQIEYYQNGSYEYTAFDGCFDHTYTFNNLKFNKVFLIAMSMYSTSMNGNYETPKFSEEQEGSIKFWGTDATVELIITKTDSGWKTDSYDCD